jgi:anti-sigma regulatory factor (Ser/Thr protein kinase)/predicted ArsR family transcriptional regulator
MDWCMTANHEAASELRRALSKYLARHAAPDADIEGAEIVISELLTNAVEHAGTMIWVGVDWGAKNPVLSVHDLGPDFVPPDDAPAADAPTGRGLMLATALSIDLDAAKKSAGGNCFRAVLDIERAPSPSFDPDVPERFSRLPELDEADGDGYFGRESFLKALVVEVTNNLELDRGPAAAEAVVARVGASVGQRMEEAYRTERSVTGPLSVDDVSELALGLKRAIDGDFYVISADEDKVVFGNRACPFGDSVKQAPSLCRMTSSVFGGIAARNSGRDVAVHLEERIALGDPECRVVVWFNPPPSEVEVFVHRYRSRTGD